jgi:phosphopantothenoylcysteine synthetase/decarboxylase
MMDILLSAGPIPARLDAVKIITNRFKGGLAIKTAQMLRDHNVRIVAWEGNDYSTEIPIIPVRDVEDYYEVMRDTHADAYILAAAVANLMPSDPLEGKFPSHNYKVGDKFPIIFEIAPRIIDKIRAWHPKSTLIGYKLFDADGLIPAGRKVLQDSRAHVVFCNTPKDAKLCKIALTQSGAEIEQTFDEHVDFIEQAIRASHYSTQQVNGVGNVPHYEQLCRLLKIIIVTSPIPTA